MAPRRHAPLPSRAHFLRRFARSAAAAGSLVAGSLLLGVLGYHLLAGLSWIDEQILMR